MYFDILLKIHLITVAFWFGILGAELIIERTRAKSKIHSQMVAYQHYWIDLLFETPAFTTVLITGILLIDPSRTEPLYWAKIAFGLLTVFGNILCTIAIIKRKFASDRENKSAVIQNSKFVDKLSAISIPAGIITILLAIMLHK